LALLAGYISLASLTTKNITQIAFVLNLNKIIFTNTFSLTQNPIVLIIASITLSFTHTIQTLLEVIANLTSFLSILEIANLANTPWRILINYSMNIWLAFSTIVIVWLWAGTRDTKFNFRGTCFAGFDIKIPHCSCNTLTNIV
jgi:hypothetical protein